VTGDDLLLVTSRLAVPRRWGPADLAAYAELNADLEVMAHLGGRALTREESDAFARYGEDWHRREGLGLLPVRLRADGGFLGMAGLHRHRWYPDEVEVGWRFARHAWGHGYATEAAACWLDRAFGPLGLSRVVSITVPANTRSLAVMRRLGLQPWRQDRHRTPAGELDVVVLAITAAQWRERPAGPPPPRPAAR
jgi:RimJ/RimL family protein N-acetyltransferase